MIRIVADDKIPFLKGVFEPFAKVFYIPGSGIDRKIASGADALLIRTRTICNEELLHGTPVKFIGTATIGHDHIDIPYCESHSITWTSAPGCNSGSVQQYIASALITLSQRNRFRLKGKTLGIVGAGHVGSKVEKLAVTLGMKVLLNDPPRQRREGGDLFTPLRQVLEGSDIVTLHVPLTPEGMDATYHLVGRESFSMMKPGAWLINTSRGGVVDTDALKKALSGGTLAGAVIDVWENEPLIDRELLPQVFLATPHIAGYSADGKANGTAMVVRALAHFFGVPLTGWFPAKIPPPEREKIDIRGIGKDEEQIAGEAILSAYAIEEDNRRFRTDPESFEQLRGAYPLRREFPAYRVKLSGASPASELMIRELGFRTTDQ